MSIKDQLMEDMKLAMKNKEKVALSVIRMARASIKNLEIDGKKELNDEDVAAVLMKEVKLRQDSLAEFEKAGRAELIDGVKQEIAVLQKYLPEQLSDEELKAIVTEAVQKVGASSPKDMGKVMAVVMPLTKGRADGKRINELVKACLNQ